MAKYCYKGYDCAFIEVGNIDVNFKEDSDMKHINENNEDKYEYDEVKQYSNTRYMYMSSGSDVQIIPISITWNVTYHKAIGCL